MKLVTNMHMFSLSDSGRCLQLQMFFLHLFGFCVQYDPVPIWDPASFCDHTKAFCRASKSSFFPSFQRPTRIRDFLGVEGVDSVWTLNSKSSSLETLNPA